jgi:hypothetical protein
MLNRTLRWFAAEGFTTLSPALHVSPNPLQPPNDS